MLFRVTNHLSSARSKGSNLGNPSGNETLFSGRNDFHHCHVGIHGMFWFSLLHLLEYSSNVLVQFIATIPRPKCVASSLGQARRPKNEWKDDFSTKWHPQHTVAYPYILNENWPPHGFDHVSVSPIHPAICISMYCVYIYIFVYTYYVYIYIYTLCIYVYIYIYIMCIYIYIHYVCIYIYT